MSHPLHAAPANSWADPPRRLLFAVLAFGLLVCLPSVVGWTRHPEPESQWWVTFLFFAPLILQAVGLWTLRERATCAFWWHNYWATLFCQSVYFWLWVAYSHPPFTGWVWSLVAFLSTVVALGFVIVMTFAVMRVSPGKGAAGLQAGGTQAAAGGAPTAQTQPGGDKQGGDAPPLGRWEDFFKELSAGVGAHPFWSVAFFMSLFLGVTYLFSFALAFHDRRTLAENSDMPALYMAKRDSVDDKYARKSARGLVEEGISAGQSSDLVASAPAPPGANAPTTGQPEEFCFHFDEVKANVNQRKYGCNNCSLDAIVKSLTEKIEQGRRARVTLLGHTDNEPIRVAESSPVRYLSNYELSEARAQNVQHEVLRRLTGKLGNLETIQWVIYPAADEPLYQVNHRALDKVASGAELDRYRNDEKSFIEEIDRKLPKEEKRVVIATVETINERPIAIGPEQLRGIINVQGEQLSELQRIKKWQDSYAEDSKPKQLRLMDYVYFSIYTITTTGYGDIMPNTAYAKFVTSVANIFEVIFLVVFFNSIISLKGSGDSSPEPELVAVGTPKSGGRLDHPERASATAVNFDDARKARQQP